MRKLIPVLMIFLPLIATAETDAEKPAEPPLPPRSAPGAEPVRPAVSALPDWSVGAGFGFFVSGLVFSAPAGGMSLAPGIAGAGLWVPTQPRFTTLIERRLSERLFLTFQCAAS